MKKLLTVIPLVILLCFTFGCQQKGEEVSEEAVIDIEAEKAAVKTMLDEWIQSLRLRIWSWLRKSSLLMMIW